MNDEEIVRAAAEGPGPDSELVGVDLQEIIAAMARRIVELERRLREAAGGE